MTGVTLLRLYPRAWRERYGDEFLALVGDGPVSMQQAIDIVFGAIDARVARTARRTAAPAAAPSGGGLMLQVLRMGCDRPASRVTTRDSLLGAAAVILGSVAAVILGRYLQSLGYVDVGETVMGFGVPVAVMLSMPFTLFKGQPWRAQAVFIGGVFVLLGLIAIAATLI
jgi:hypothetical protein